MPLVVKDFTSTNVTSCEERCYVNRTSAGVLAGLAVAGATVGALSALPARNAPRRIEVVIESRFGSFTPRVIRAQQGDTVHVTLRALDVAHGFKVQGTDIEVTAMPGQSAEITFVADWVGGREWYCTLSCGPQHGTMTGMVVVGRRSRR